MLEKFFIKMCYITVIYNDLIGIHLKNNITSLYVCIRFSFEDLLIGKCPAK